jgi:hypothetical protein
MVKIDDTNGCDQQATFYVKATLTSLITTGTPSSSSSTIFDRARPPRRMSWAPPAFRSHRPTTTNTNLNQGRRWR